MPVLTGDIQLHSSTATSSSGGSIAVSTITSNAMNNVFPDVSDSERQAGGDIYRKLFWKNENASDPLVAAVIYTPSLPGAQATISVGLGFDTPDDANPLQGAMVGMTAPAVVQVVSDTGGDLRAVTVWGINNADGTPATETVTLNGTTPVQTTTVFSTIWAVHAESTHVSAVITAKQGPGGPIKGTIPAAEVATWLWVVSADTKAAGISLPDLDAGQNYGVWLRLEWAADCDPLRPGAVVLRIEEAG